MVALMMASVSKPVRIPEGRCPVAPVFG